MVVTWNALDASANINLSGGSLTATTTSATQGAVRANLSAAAGKVYFSGVATNGGTTGSIGWANATAALGTAIGTNTNSVAIRFANGQVLINNSVLATLYQAINSAVVESAWDITNKLIWFRVNHGFWNNSVTANPATGTGGISTATMAAGPYFPIFSANASGAQITAQFGALEPIYDIPSGFSTLDTAIQLYEAIASFKGYAVSGGFQNAISIAKLLGYVVIQQFPFGIEQVFENPRRLPKTNQRIPGFEFSLAEDFYIQPPYNPASQSFETPRRPIARQQGFVFSPFFAPGGGHPTFGQVWDLPMRHQRFTPETINVGAFFPRRPQFAYLLLASL